MAAANQGHHSAGFYVPPLYAVAVYVLPLLAPELPIWAPPAVGVAVMLLGGMAASAAYPARIHGETHNLLARGCAWATGAATAAWLLCTQLAGGPLAELGGTPMWQWLLLGAAVLGGWWCLVVWRAEAAASAMDVARDELPGPPLALPAGPVDPRAVEWAGILARAGVTGIEVASVTTSESGAVETVHLRSAARPGERKGKLSTLVSKIDDVVVEASATLEVTRGIDELVGADIQAIPGKNAHSFKLLVTLSKEQRQIPYPLRSEPRDPMDALLLGVYADDRPIRLHLCNANDGASHMTVLGMSGAGKGNLANVMLAELTASTADEVWAAASEKLVQLVYKWLVPWIEGVTDRPVLDRVAGESQTEILRMLADAVHFVELSNRQIGRSPVRPWGPGRSKLTIVLDESSEILEKPEKIVLWDGRRMNASELWALLKQLSRTALVSCVDMSQYGLFTSSGSQGSKQRRNTGAGACGRLRRRQDMGSVMPGMPAHVDPTLIPKGEFFFMPDLPQDEVVAMRGRPFSMWQEVEVTPVAIAHTKWRTGLDPAITGQLQWYASRWSAERLPELVETARAEGFEWPRWTDTPPVAQAESGPAEEPAVSSAPESPAPADQEAPEVPAEDFPDLPDLPAGTLPDNFLSDEFDVWALFDGAQRPKTDAVPGLPAPDKMREAAQRYAAQLRAEAAKASVPDPLGSVLRLLSLPGAPTDWVATDTLARALGYYDADADAETRKRATEALGLKLARQIGEQSEDIPRSVLRRWELEARQARGEPVGGPVETKKRRGWQVERLRAAGERLRQQARGA